MLEIPRRYVVDEENRPVAVQLDLETFDRILHVLEDHALGRLVAEGAVEEELLSLDDARAFYETLDRSQ